MIQNFYFRVCFRNCHTINRSVWSRQTAGSGLTSEPWRRASWRWLAEKRSDWSLNSATTENLSARSLSLSGGALGGSCPSRTSSIKRRTTGNLSESTGTTSIGTTRPFRTYSSRPRCQFFSALSFHPFFLNFQQRGLSKLWVKALSRAPITLKTGSILLKIKTRNMELESLFLSKWLMRPDVQQQKVTYATNATYTRRPRNGWNSCTKSDSRNLHDLICCSYAYFLFYQSTLHLSYPIFDLQQKKYHQGCN